MSVSLESICKNYNIPLENGKLAIPPNIQRVKLDVGMSYNAPFSTRWLGVENDLLVFGFEPNPETYHFLVRQDTAHFHTNGATLPPIPYTNKRLFIFPIALSDVGNVEMDFYQMNNDCGVSSLYKPNNDFFTKNPEYSVQAVTKVPVFTLKDFFDIFPFDKIPYIEYIKIDAQGSDLNIVKGAGERLQTNVVFVTLEADGHYYDGANNCNIDEINAYMTSIGFLPVQHPNTVDPTFLNHRFIELANSIFILQRM